MNSSKGSTYFCVPGLPIPQYSHCWTQTLEISITLRTSTSFCGKHSCRLALARAKSACWSSPSSSSPRRKTSGLESRPVRASRTERDFSPDEGLLKVNVLKLIPLHTKTSNAPHRDHGARNRGWGHLLS